MAAFVDENRNHWWNVDQLDPFLFVENTNSYLLEYWMFYVSFPAPHSDSLQNTQSIYMVPNMIKGYV